MPACFFRTGLVAALTVTATLTVATRADAQDEGPGRRAAPTSGRPGWFGLSPPPSPSCKAPL